MAATTPYDQLVGTVKIYLATYGTAEPDVTSAPSASWVELGCTEGDQTYDESGELTKFYDNCHMGPVKTVLGQQDPMVTFNLVGLTLENVARSIRSVGAVTTPSASLKRLALKRTAAQTEYALLFKGDADSPYGNYPGQIYLPRGVFDGKLALTRAKTGRPAVAVTFHALEDDTQSELDRLGWMTVQVS